MHQLVRYQPRRCLFSYARGVGVRLVRNAGWRRSADLGLTQGRLRCKLPPHESEEIESEEIAHRFTYKRRLREEELTMGMLAGRVLLALVLILALGAAGLASVEAAIPVTTYHAVIDSTRSTVTLQRDDFLTISESVPPQPITMSISGKFDIEVSEWEWQPIGGSVGPFQPQPYRETWVDFKNPDFTLDQPGHSFDFPSFMVQLINTVLNGSSHPCNFPSPPYESCSGYYTGVLAEVQGTFDGRRLQMEGKTWHNYGDDYYTYSITATVVPLPAPVLLMASALLFGLLPAACRRHRWQERVATS